MINTTSVILLLIALILISSIIVQCARADPPDADFNPDCGGNQGGGGTTLVAFVDNSTGVVDSYAWDFGDGTTSAEKNPNKTYMADGNYTVKHTARNSAGYDTIIKGYSTKCPHPLIVDFYAVPIYGTKPLLVQFNDTSTSEDPATNTFFWEFGDGQNSSVQNATHTYNNDGVYTVNLTVHEKNSHHETLSKQNYIHVGGLSPDFSGTPTCGHSPLTVNFTDLSAFPHDHWEWNFGDGNSSTLQNPSNTYTGEGAYTVSLYVSNTAGGTHGWISRSDYIHVIPEGQASFTATRTSGNSPLTVQFNDTSIGFLEPVSYLWDFDDNDQTSNQQNSSYTFDTYDSIHEYHVTLTVTDSCGQTDYMTQTITVTSSVLEFTINGAVNSWILNKGSNTNDHDLSMTVRSNSPWKVSVVDNMLGNPTGTAGHLAEYDYSGTPHYVTGGKVLALPLHVKEQFDRALSGTPQDISAKIATPSDGTTYPLELIQDVGQSDYSLATNRGYRMVITFTASQTI